MNITMGLIGTEKKIWEVPEPEPVVIDVPDTIPEPEKVPAGG